MPSFDVYEGSLILLGKLSDKELNELPNIIEGDLLIGDNQNFKSILSLERVLEVKSDCNLSACRIEDFSGIGRKCFERINGTLSINIVAQSSILGILTIKGLEEIKMFESSLNRIMPYHNDAGKIEPFWILIRHLEGDRDIMECQEEMIQAEFTKYARL